MRLGNKPNSSSAKKFRDFAMFMRTICRLNMKGYKQPKAPQAPPKAKIIIRLIKLSIKLRSMRKSKLMKKSLKK